MSTDRADRTDRGMRNPAHREATAPTHDPPPLNPSRSPPSRIETPQSGGHVHPFSRRGADRPVDPRRDRLGRPAMRCNLGRRTAPLPAPGQHPGLRPDDLGSPSFPPSLLPGRPGPGLPPGEGRGDEGGAAVRIVRPVHRPTLRR